MLNSCIPYCTNPQCVALPPTHSFWQSDTHIYWHPRTPTLPLLMAICSRLMYKSAGFSVEACDKLRWAVKTQITFMQLITDGAPLPHSHNRDCDPKTAASAWLQDMVWWGTPRQSFDSRANSSLHSPICFAAQWPPPVISCSHFFLKCSPLN